MQLQPVVDVEVSEEASAAEVADVAAEVVAHVEEVADAVAKRATKSGFQ